jgi:hypothetical protein
VRPARQRRSIFPGWVPRCFRRRRFLVCATTPIYPEELQHPFEPLLSGSRHSAS